MSPRALVTWSVLGHRWRSIAVTAMVSLLLAPACGESPPAPGGSGGSGNAAGGAGGNGGKGGSGGRGGAGAGGLPDASAPDVAPTADAGAADTASDTAAPDTRPPDGPPADGPSTPVGCPGPEAYVGDQAWKHRALATASATYCATWRLGRTIKEELAAKAMVRVAPGTYPLLDRAETAPFALPLCLLRPGVAPVAAGTGTLRTTTTPGGYLNFALNQPLVGGAGSFGGGINGPAAGGTFTITLDGAHPDPNQDRRFHLELCTKASCMPGERQYFDGCSYEGVTPRIHMVTFTGGSVALEFRHDTRGITVGIEPAAFVRANGTYKGVAFDQRDYFKLVYSPTVNHHFVRHFAVLFDAPIDGACGLEIENVSGAGPNMPRAYAVTCALDRMSQLPVSAAN
jgi:hypothetical protein